MTERLAFRIREGKELGVVLSNERFESLPPLGTIIRGYRDVGEGDYRVIEYLPADARSQEYYDYEVVLESLEEPYPVLPGLKFRYLHKASFAHRCTICGRYLGQHRASHEEHYRIAKQERIPAYAVNWTEMKRVKAALGLTSWTPFRNRFR